jgi:hypothetical protein
VSNRAELQRIAERVFDGTVTRGERERLEAAITADPVLRGIWDDLMAARGALAGAGLENAPHGLRPAVLRAVAAESRQRVQRPSWVESFAAAFRARPVLALGSALAIGVVIGVFAIAALTGGFEAGSKLAPSTIATMPAAPEAAAPVVLDLDGAHVLARSEHAANGENVVRADVIVRGGAGAPTSVEFAPGQAPGGVRVTLRTGAGQKEGTLSRP